MTGYAREIEIDDEWKQRLDEACDDTRAEERERFKKLVESAQRVIYCWNHARITNEPMIDALVNLRDALEETHV